MSEPSRGATKPRESLLDAIRGPEDLRRLPATELPAVCEEIRAFLLQSVQETGGHLGSNLGVVEIATALHYVFDLRRDRVVWDVSHQCYPHKVLTGRRDRFPMLRQTDGLCGFTHPGESEYDLFHTGHAGTSIALGLGLALGTAHEATRPHVISVIGDASLGAGVAFEALNHAGSVGERLIVVLNDNEWSISQSVGALARYLSRIRSSRTVQRAQQEIHGLLQSIPVIGDRVERTLHEIREVLRHSIVQGHVFEELGVTYVGPIDGHDVRDLVDTFERSRQLDGVVLVHALTQKGKGHPDAPTHPERVHAAKPGAGRATAAKDAAPVEGADEGEQPKDKAVPRVVAAPKSLDFTRAFGDAAIAVAERDVRVHVITAGMPSGTGLVEFSQRFPTRFHDVGITEQHGVGLAAGLAKAGMRPIVAIYSTFLQRAYDQVFQEVCLQGLPVLFAMDRGGLVGQDGPTHNGVYDLAFLRTLPGIVLAAPRDATDVRRMIDLALRLDGPLAVRWPRDTCPADERISAAERRAMEPGKAEVLCEGQGVCIWAYGALVNQALEAARRLRRAGIEIGVVDARFCKPLDEDLLARHAREYKHLVTLEEHQRAGGFGSAVLEALSRVPDARVGARLLAIPDRYIEHMSSRDEQLAACGLDADAIERAVRQLLRPVPR